MKESDGMKLKQFFVNSIFLSLNIILLLIALIFGFNYFKYFNKLTY